MMTSAKHNLVFVAITKTATRSIYAALKKHFDGELVQEHQKEIPPQYAGLFTFAVLRNPYDRLVSVYWATCRRGNDAYGFKKYVSRTGTFAELVDNLDSVMEDPSELALPQVEWVKPNRIDRFLRFENIAAEWAALPFNTTGVKLERLNPTVKEAGPQNPVARESWETFMTPDIKAIIREKYADDFDLIRSVYANNN